MKKLILTLLSITMGLLLGNHYSPVMRKMLVEYILAAYLSVRLINNDDSDLITVRKYFR
jgi:hypothetical protein